MKLKYEITDQLIVAGHDISDGGLVVWLLEMAFAGVCGFDVDIPAAEAVQGIRSGDPLHVFFSEEIGWILQVRLGDQQRVVQRYRQRHVPCVPVGLTIHSGPHSTVIVIAFIHSFIHPSNHPLNQSFIHSSI